MLLCGASLITPCVFGEAPSGDPVQARLLEQIKRYPKDPDLLIQLARLVDQDGRTMEALSLLRQARQLSPDYEDIYLLEAILLAKLNNRYACEDRDQLIEAYAQLARKGHAEDIARHLSGIDGDRVVIEAGAGRDWLDNNRGTWDSRYVMAKYVDCGNNSYYGGYERVHRYAIDDAQWHLGVALPFQQWSYALEFQAADREVLLPRQGYSLQVRHGFTAGPGLRLTYSHRQYPDLETDSRGLGLDHYVGNYLLDIAREWSETRTADRVFDTAYVDKLGLSYYFAKDHYVGLSWSKGTELAYDNSDNPPYSKIRTTLLKGLYPISADWSLVYELKRHQQSGYFDQDGVRIGVRCRY